MVPSRAAVPARAEPALIAAQYFLVQRRRIDRLGRAQAGIGLWHQGEGDSKSDHGPSSTMASSQTPSINPGPPNSRCTSVALSTIILLISFSFMALGNFFDAKAQRIKDFLSAVRQSNVFTLKWALTFVANDTIKSIK
jgi:hypothetical protein